MKATTISAVLAGVMCLSMSSFAHADKHAFNDAESAVKYRQSALSIMRDNFAAMAAMVKGEEPYDAAVFSNRASDFARLTHIPWDGFAVEGAMPGDDTDALPAIWDNWEDFESRANQLITDADSLVDAAASGSMDEIKPAFMAAAKNCKGCHDQYKD
ncbi:cytochrome C556 [Idiomarina sp. MD25a]|uniref:c-type cytochrome n=1 Tax=Idiomarina sp. MD25a TaxID=1889913 RepID=UPI0008F80D4B|nr:cytochrome c [Idiomarina sp. MD25a]OIN01766.1 cytochrome C556 [Idiomarina sp. MD25a]